MTDRPPKSTVPAHQPKEHAASPATVRAMILDDSPVILATLKDMLAGCGVSTVKTAKTVKDGVKLFKDYKPDIVFVDLMLGDTESGLDFLKQALASHPKARVVVSTALPSTADAVVMAVSLGATEYLPKPFKREDVKALVDKITKPGDESGMFYG